MRFPSRFFVRYLLCSLAIGFLVSGGIAPCRASASSDTKTADASGAVDGYETYGQFADHLERLAKSSPCVRLESLAKTSEKSDAKTKSVFLVTVGHPDAKQADKNRAVLVLGSVEPNRPLGSELCVRMIESFFKSAQDEKQYKKNGGPVLSKTTFYFIPRPAPEAYEAFFQKPYRERTANNRPVDDDHDGHTDEDGPDDLNGDGWITLMRVEDPRGNYLPHPKDPRVMIRANTHNRQRGRYLLFQEGIDNDHDGQFNEDPQGGVVFNRNFPFDYDYFGRGAGPHQVSEPETRAVADFAFDHPNIGAVFSFSADDNLMHPWQPDARRERDRIKTHILANDASYLRWLLARYPRVLGLKDAPASRAEQGSFARWAYFHFGRPSLSARGWWIPGLEQEPKLFEQHTGDQFQALRWFKEQKIDGFVPWTKVDHPDFPGRTVEIGGFKPFLQTTPPAKELDRLAKDHARFLGILANSFARLKVDHVKTEPLDGGLYRVTAMITNEGALPTELSMGGLSRQTYPIQVELLAPKATEFIKGSRRTKIGRLGPMGGHAEVTWLLRIPPSGKDQKETPPKFQVRAWSPSVGKASSK